ncbi:hypothetical protein KAFR_0D00900 [Kazachstania africana CBS 2517]|uniref:Elongation factor G, mitochondrial n=1 Tax=Kazachstania africana (strain ATCC 22294 / BCRC 22015 / CBS 2517 / CECT 1963 / NBRC 1671 / NRRL Y-8276) TaxID=1071382 RepID=H2ATN7_KAZAF|nr:hypothetical protein KAFR_0D00900 [Kazachstania africana CBS 2517]CCF57737.1 hypothetical protein KAFR_0D00900 [Kazachstania africana CBS 2517]
MVLPKAILRQTLNAAFVSKARRAASILFYYKPVGFTRNIHRTASNKLEYDEEKHILDELRSKMSAEDRETSRKLRNIGISAHIDSGKTTFTERVLYYTGRIKAIHEVRGRDSVGAKMDSMDLEREKGITIQSAATYCSWLKNNENHHFNLIDTPGHIDFTIEVERALRVLDGAVLVVCAVSGVQSQTVTVDNQMRRYNVPRITFINKMDRMGADPFRAIAQLNAKLKVPAATLQVPIGSESNFKGVIDIINKVALYNRGVNGETIDTDTIPYELKALVEEKRQVLIETLADVDDEMAEIFLEEKEPSVDEIKGAIRRATIARKFTPVLLGSALANTGIQHVLDAIIDYLPDPSEVLNTAFDVSKEESKVNLVSSSHEPFVGLAFKLEEGKYGQLTYIRVYQGSLKKGSFIKNIQTGKKVKVSRLVRMHSEEMEDVEEVGAGEICATFGIDCASGNTFTDGSIEYSMSSMYVPDSVVSLSIKPKSKDLANFSKALNRFQKEDPTFRARYDEESKETIISGMGELHLEIYIERMKREYNVECETGKPQVSYRESITIPADFDYTHKKQSGGAGQFGRVAGTLSPVASKVNEFETAIVSGAIPEKFLAACKKGFDEACEKGPIIGHRVLGVKMLINDGAIHSVDSNELSFKIATKTAYRNAFLKAQPVILEPIMKVSVTAPNEFQGNIISLLNKLQAVIQDTENNHDDFTLEAECPLASMFGFVTSLRAATQGKGEFSLEFSHYAPTLPNVQRELIADFNKRQENK